jgi:hypothetical protein
MFLWLAHADAKGSPASFSDLRAEFEVFGRSVHTTYKIWLDRSPQFPNALGWLETRPHPDDGRRQTIHLTDKGAKRLRAVLMG